MEKYINKIYMKPTTPKNKQTKKKSSPLDVFSVDNRREEWSNKTGKNEQPNGCVPNVFGFMNVIDAKTNIQMSLFTGEDGIDAKQAEEFLNKECRLNVHAKEGTSIETVTSNLKKGKSTPLLMRRENSIGHAVVISKNTQNEVVMTDPSRNTPQIIGIDDIKRFMAAQNCESFIFFNKIPTTAKGSNRKKKSVKRKRNILLTF